MQLIPDIISGSIKAIMTKEIGCFLIFAFAVTFACMCEASTVERSSTMIDTFFIEEEAIIGYSDDFTQTHFRHLVRTQAGELKTMYSTHTTIQGSIHIGKLTETRPHVARPLQTEQTKRSGP